MKRNSGKGSGFARGSSRAHSTSPLGAEASLSSSFGKGRTGEAAAAAILESEGWSILERNFRSPAGEIDIVAVRGGILAFIEVKSWTSFGLSELSDSIGARKRRRIVETSKIFLSLYRQYSSMQARYDIVLLRGETVVRHIESAFTGEP